MDKDAEKRYRDLSPKEKYDSAVKAEKEPWNPLDAAKALVEEKMSPKKDVKKGIEEGITKGTSGKDLGLKKGGSVKSKCKCMCRGGGIEVRGKTKGRMV